MIVSARAAARGGSYLTFPGKSSVKLTGEAKHWDIVGDTGNVKTRAFCPACGSPVSLTLQAVPDLFTVHAASLDDPGRYKPQVVTPATASGYAWDHINPAMPKFDKMPPTAKLPACASIATMTWRRPRTSRFYSKANRAMDCSRTEPGERKMMLKDKVAVIYGAGGAVGGAVARAFAREGRLSSFSPGGTGLSRSCCQGDSFCWRSRRGGGGRCSRRTGRGPAPAVGDR